MAQYDVLQAICDLIDTQWNVNADSTDLIMLNALGFNRYIVECKFGCILSQRTIEADLIDTQWNVNDSSVSIYVSTKSDLIDTQWNVNLSDNPRLATN